MSDRSATDLLIIHREYRYRGGEEAFLDEHLLPGLTAVGATYDVLRLPPLEFGVTNLAELVTMALGFELLRPSYRRIATAIQAKRYRGVLFNNFIPTVSLRAPALCKSMGLRVFHWAHNSRFVCANGLSFDGQQACSACFDRGSRSVLGRRCFGSRLQGALYALIYRSRRVPRTLFDSIDELIVSAEFTNRDLRRAASTLDTQLRSRVIRMSPGAPLRGCELSPNVAQYVEQNHGTYFLFVGRLSFEKGIDRFVDLAKLHPSSSFAVAGSGPMEAAIRANAPQNVTFFGFVSPPDRQALIEGASALVVPSRAPENSPIVLFESHFARTPVYYVPGGGAEEVTMWLGRDGRPLDQFVPAARLVKKGRSFSGNEFRDALADWIRSL